MRTSNVSTNQEVYRDESGEVGCSLSDFPDYDYAPIAKLLFG